MKKLKLIISWVLRVLISLGFLLASIGKLTNNSQVIDMFNNWGYPNNFHFFIGVFELILALLLLIPKTLKIGILGITIILIGAMVTHLINDPPVELIRPIIFLLLLGGIYFINYYKKI